MATITRKIEILAIERERVVERLALLACPICQGLSEWLTPRQAGRLLQVQPRSVRRWLAEGRAHGIRTPGGRHRVCKQSLFSITQSPDSVQRLRGGE